MKTLLRLAACAALIATAHAQPAYMNYQGKLTDSLGQPLPSSGTNILEFNIHTAATGGSLVWGPFLCDGTNTPGHTAKAIVSSGRFNVILGPTDTTNRPIGSVFSNSTLFLDIKVNGASIIPRQQFLSAPYAYQAAQAAQAAVSATTTDPQVARRNTANTFTANQTVTGTATVSGTVTAGGLNLPTNLHGANRGYQELPNGLLLQWGNAESTIDESQSFNFPTAFAANACYSVVISRISPGANSPLCPATWSNTGFTIDRENGLDNDIPFTYMAIGKKP